MSAFVLLVSGLAVSAGLLGAVRNASAVPTNSLVCNPSNTSPSALNIPLADAGLATGPGAKLVISFEFEALNYTPAFAGRALYFPSLSAVLPLAGTGTVTSVMSPLTTTVSGPNWSIPITHSKVMSVSENFSSTKSAYLTSSKIAVMVNASYGSIVMGFRWNYSIAPAIANQSGTTTSAWSTPNASASSPYLPSIFFPAPYVLLSGTSHQPAIGGSIFIVSLKGAVGNTTFRIVVEYPSNGTETFSHWEPTHLRTVQFNATANLSFSNGAPLPAGNYLIHVHDRCQAIVKSLTVSVVAKSPMGLGRIAES